VVTQQPQLMNTRQVAACALLLAPLWLLTEVSRKSRTLRYTTDQNSKVQYNKVLKNSNRAHFFFFFVNCSAFPLAVPFKRGPLNDKRGQHHHPLFCLWASSHYSSGSP